MSINPAWDDIFSARDWGMMPGTGLILMLAEKFYHFDRKKIKVLDLGTGSGILAMAAAKVLHRKVLATDIDPWSVRVARSNAKLNRMGPMLRAERADGWLSTCVRKPAPYDLVFANILARPLCAMAKDLAQHLAPGGTVILAGLLTSQRRWVLHAHRQAGLVLESTLHEGRWATLVLRKR